MSTFKIKNETFVVQFRHNLKLKDAFFIILEYIVKCIFIALFILNKIQPAVIFGICKIFNNKTGIFSALLLRKKQLLLIF